MDDLKVVAVPYETLLPNPYNPNQQSLADFELLVKSIEEDGFTLPVVVNDGSKNPALKNMIIDGEHRWRAAGVLGMAEVPVVYKGMDEAEMRVSTIRHNTARGHHDAVLEASLINELSQTVSREELSEQLNIDPVELDILTTMSSDMAALESVSSTIEEEVVAELVAANVPQSDAEIVGKRHALIGGKTVLSEQDMKKHDIEKDMTVRFEFIFEGEQAKTVRAFVNLHKSPLKAMMAVFDFIQSREG